MYRGQRIAVVIPAFNEERAVARTVRSVPGFVDHVLVVDDASTDRTVNAARRLQAPRPRAPAPPCQPRRGRGHRHPATGARSSSAATLAAVMAGDGQMDPARSARPPRRDRRRPLRLREGQPLRHAGDPGARCRSCGSSATWCSRVSPSVTSGYPQLFDSQCGYTAASRRALEVIDSAGLFPRYGYPNDLLARLWAERIAVVDVPVRAVYGPDWRSGIRLSTVVYPMSFVLVGSLLRRLVTRYLRLGQAPQAQPLPPP